MPTQPPAADPGAKYTATFDTTEGSFTVELFAADSPNTVGDFVGLAESGSTTASSSTGSSRTS